MEQRVRIRDIAQELGLSTATVSNVIHGKTQKVSPETVKRVQEVLAHGAAGICVMSEMMECEQPQEQIEAFFKELTHKNE